MDLGQVENKTCTKCKQEKTSDCFYSRKETGGLMSHCIQCTKTRYQDRYATNPEYMARTLASSRKWQSENPLKSRFLIARANALNGNRRRVIPWSLTFEQCIELWNKGCHYCKSPIVDNKGSGLDRKDNNLGYELANVLPCCGDCNKIRNTVLTVEEMEVAMKAVLDLRSPK